MKYQFLNKVQTPEMINITIKKVFDEQTSEWQGKQSRYKNCLVDWDGKEYYSKFTPKYYPIAIEGNKVSAVRKVINGSPFFEYYSGGDGMTPNPGIVQQNQPPSQDYIPPPMEPIVNEPMPIENKIPNLPGRGACFNLAFQFCLENKPPEEFQVVESFEEFMKRVTLIAEKILPYQDKFVNQL